MPTRFGHWRVLEKRSWGAASWKCVTVLRLLCKLRLRKLSNNLDNNPDNGNLAVAALSANFGGKTLLHGNEFWVRYSKTAPPPTRVDLGKGP